MFRTVAKKVDPRSGLPSSLISMWYFTRPYLSQ
jgi:hypothetical protein